nr:MAG TPA: holin [Caudoviricetes sp.]
MKAVNIPVRLKNPWFWVGVVSIIITAIGLDPTTMTSWGAVLDAAEAVLRNPVQLVTAVLAVLAVFVDPTTAGLSDSARALSYKCPNKDK